MYHSSSEYVPVNTSKDKTGERRGKESSFERNREGIPFYLPYLLVPSGLDINPIKPTQAFSGPFSLCCLLACLSVNRKNDPQLAPEPTICTLRWTYCIHNTIYFP